MVPQMTLKAQAIKEKTDKLDIKIKKFYVPKYKPQNGRKVLQTMYQIRELYVNIKSSYNSVIKTELKN